MEKEKPLLDQLNARFKKCLDINKLIQIAQNKLKAEIQAEIASRGNPALPQQIEIEANPITKNIYINGFLNIDGIKTKIAHVSLHLKEEGLEDIIGAIHGKSNTEEKEFIRFFFDYVNGVPKLVTFGQEGWTLYGINRDKYNTLIDKAQREFIHIVFEVINSHLPEVMKSQKECFDILNSNTGNKKENNNENNSSLQSSTAAAAASSSSAAYSNIPAAAAASSITLPMIEPSTTEEKNLVASFIELINFVKLGKDSGYYCFPISNYYVESFLLNKKDLKKISPLLDYNIQNIDSNIDLVTKMDNKLEKSQIQPPNFALIKRRMKTFFDFENSYREFIIEVQKILGEVINSFEEYNKKTGIDTLEKFFPYIKTKIELPENKELSNENIKNWVNSLDEKEKYQKAESVKKGGFASLNILFMVAYIEFEFKNIEYEDEKAQNEEKQNTRIKISKMSIEQINIDIKGFEKKIREYKNTIQEKNQEIKDLEKYISSSKNKNNQQQKQKRLESYRRLKEYMEKKIIEEQENIKKENAKIYEFEEVIKIFEAAKKEENKDLYNYKLKKGKKLQAIYDIIRTHFKEKDNIPRILVNAIPSNTKGGARKKTQRIQKKRRITQRKH